MVTQNQQLDSFGHVRLGGIGQWLAEQLEAKTGKEARTVVLGHIQRGGTPTAFDRVLSTRFGLQAIDAVHEGDFGKMVALRGTDIVRIPLIEAPASSRPSRWSATPRPRSSSAADVRAFEGRVPFPGRALSRSTSSGGTA